MHFKELHVLREVVASDERRASDEWTIVQDSEPSLTPTQHSVEQVGVNLTILLAKHPPFVSPYKKNNATLFFFFL